MPFFDEETLKKQVKSGDFSRVYVLYGEESFLKQHYANTISSKTAGADFRDFNLHILEGKDTDLNEISDCVLSFPMMSEYSCTIVNDFPLNSYVGDKGKIHESFEEIISNLPDTTVLIFRMENIEIDEKNTKWSKILKYIDSKGGICANLGKRTTTQLSKLLIDSAKKKNCELSRDDANYMVAVIGDDMSTLRNELDKVCGYTGTGTISRADIDKTVITSVEAKVFSLSRFIVSGEADKAFTTLSNLFKLREEPVAILGVLSKAYVDMYRAKAIKEKGLPASKLAEYFPSSYRGRDFIISNAVRDSARYSLLQLHKALDVLSETDRRLKSTGEDAQALLEELVLKLLRV